jgi:hypothetical protein
MLLSWAGCIVMRVSRLFEDGKKPFQTIDFLKAFEKIVKENINTFELPEDTLYRHP